MFHIMIQFHSKQTKIKTEAKSAHKDVTYKIQSHSLTRFSKQFFKTTKLELDVSLTNSVRIIPNNYRYIVLHNILFVEFLDFHKSSWVRSACGTKRKLSHKCVLAPILRFTIGALHCSITKMALSDYNK